MAVDGIHDVHLPDAVQREISSITAELRTRFPKEYETKLGVKVTPLQRYLVGDTRLTLMVLLGCMTLMLGIALANVLNLLLIRATSRSGEIAVRRALGASGQNIASQLLAEGALLAGAGAIGGVSLAYWGVELVTRSGAVDLLRLDEVRVDGAVLHLDPYRRELYELAEALQQRGVPMIFAIDGDIDLSGAFRDTPRLARPLHSRELAKAINRMIQAGPIAQPPENVAKPPELSLTERMDRAIAQALRSDDF